MILNRAGQMKLLTTPQLMQLRELKKKSKLFTFTPSKSLAPFVSSKGRRLFVRAANRVGKTFTACYKVAMFMLENPDCRCRIISTNYKQSANVISRYMNDFLAPWLAKGSFYNIGKGFNGDIIRLNNGSICQLRTNEQDILSFAGDSLDIVLFDEPPKNEMLFTENVSRVHDRNGQVIVTFTPIGDAVKWFKDMIESDAGNQWQQWVIKFNHDSCPHFTLEQIENIVDSAKLYPDSFEQRINAAWEGVTTAKAFNAYSPSVHVFSELTVTDDFKFIIACDHGELEGHQVALLIANDTSNNKIYVLDEYVNKTITTPEEDVANIENMLKNNGLSWHHIDKILGDINSGGKATPGRSINELMTTAIAQRLRIHINRLPPSLNVQKPVKSKGSVAYGERLINAAFAKDTLFVHDDCKETKYCLAHYKQGRNDLKHIIDGLRYGIVPILEALFDEGKLSQAYWR